jgi:hypothetical protein
MTIDVLIGSLFIFASVSGTKVRLKGRGGLWVELSVISQWLSIPLILGGILAGFLSLYVFVASEGLFLGLLYWFGIGLLLAFLVDIPLRLGIDGIVSILGLCSLLVGLWLFVQNFLQCTRSHMKVSERKVFRTEWQHGS